MKLIKSIILMIILIITLQLIMMMVTSTGKLIIGKFSDSIKYSGGDWESK